MYLFEKTSKNSESSSTYDNNKVFEYSQEDK